MREWTFLDEDATAQEIKESGQVVESDEWVPIPDGWWFHTCCDCKLSHRVEVRNGMVRHKMLPELTEQHRLAKHSEEK